MGTFITKVLSNNGSASEKDFLSLIYDEIMALDNNIVCTVKNGSSDPISPATASDFNFLNVKSTMTFTLDSDGTTLSFRTYPASWSGILYSKGYKIQIKAGSNVLIDKEYESNTGTANDNSLQFSSSALRCTGGDESSKTRKYLFTKYESSDKSILVIWINPYTSSSYKDSNGISFMRFKDQNFSENGIWHWCANVAPSVLEGRTVYNGDGTNACTKSNMFSYEARTGYLDFISHSSFISGSIKVASSTDIYDCTTVNFGDTISLKDGANFLAIGSHSMVPLS